MKKGTDGDIDMRIQRIANAGVLVDAAADMGEAFFIAIDCFCHDPQQFYRDTAPQEKQFLMERIRQKQLNILIFTHEHSDHFYVPDVLEAWQSNQELLIISNHAVTELLHSSGIPQSNLISVGGNTENGIFWIQLAAVRLGCMVTKHDGKEYKAVKNLAVLIEGLSDRIVVTGDAMPCEEFFERLHLWSQQIAQIYLPFSYVGRPSVRKRMRMYLFISSVYVLHCPRPEADVGHWVEAARKVCKEDVTDFPDIYWQNEMSEELISTGVSL